MNPTPTQATGPGPGAGPGPGPGPGPDPGTGTGLGSGSATDRDPGTDRGPGISPGPATGTGSGTGARTAAVRQGQAATARRQLNPATRHQLIASGVPDGTITSRARPGGPWQRLLPRVYLLQTGPPDHRQRALAAVLYTAEPAADPLAGATAALTGGAALALLGIRDAPHSPADVLIRAPRRRTATAGVRPLATSRWPRTISVHGVPSTRPVRAAADFASRTEDPALIRSTLARVVQAGWCHPQDLHAELREARLLTRPAVGEAAAELVAGVRSIAEARARDTLTATDLPTPLWNARLHTPDGTFLASPDAYWPDEGVALEIDSAEYHYTLDSWHATLRRRLRLESRGILVVSATPSMTATPPTRSSGPSAPSSPWARLAPPHQQQQPAATSNCPSPSGGEPVVRDGNNGGMETLETTAAVRRRMSRQKSRDTGVEVAVRKLLHGSGLRYRIHRRPMKGVRREADIVFGPTRVAVFVDGCFWHGCPEHATWPRNNADFWRKKIEGNRRRDLDTDARLTAAGWVPLRIWEHEDPAVAAARVIAVVAERRKALGLPVRNPHSEVI